MGAQIENESGNSLSWFEEQITRLYSRNLFLRDDELQALRESARLIDGYAARQFFSVQEFGSVSASMDPILLKRIIANIRKRQSRRPSDATRLAKHRDSAASFRKMHAKRGKLQKWLDELRNGGMRKRLGDLHNDWSTLNAKRSELRHKAALRLMMVVIFDAYVRGCETHADVNVDNVLKVLKFREELKKKREIYQHLLAKIKADGKTRRV